MSENTTLLKNAQIINEGKTFVADVYIKGKYIEEINPNGISRAADNVLDLTGKYLIPGIIDDQVHFREPGLTHKANIFTESRAAAAGGITSFMEMPNTVPNTLTQELLEEKYQIAAKDSLVNFSFFMGAANDNLEEVLKTNPRNVCGVKVFMGSSTGNMMVDNPETLQKIFSECKMLIATHCEDEATIKANFAKYKEQFGEDIPMEYHPIIRNEEACYKSSSLAVKLAKENGTRLHVLHISTAKELSLFDNSIPLKDKKITSEACVHHLWFSDVDYQEKGAYIKWNPAVKKASDGAAILEAINNNIIDVIATDHAPHTMEEKSQNYTKAPSGGPLVQHSFNVMWEFYLQNKISKEKIVEKMCHHPAILFRVEKRGYIKEGFFADLVVVDPQKEWTVAKENLLYKCAWSPFEGKKFQSKITHTFVNGNLVFENDKINESTRGERLLFEIL
jgi:dihydroorotase